MEIMIFKIETLAQKWFEFMVVCSIQLSLFLILILLLASIFKKQSARFLYFVWLIGLLKIFVPPTIQLPAFVSNAKFVPVNQITMLRIPEIHIITATSPTLSYQGLLFLLWLLVILLSLGFWFYKSIRFRMRIVRFRVEITNQQIFYNTILNSKKVRIFTGPNIAMPFTKGVLLPKLFLPESVLSWQQNELNAVILHEYAHIQRKDLLVIGLQSVIQMLFFFHPLVWLTNIQIARYREKACDDFAIHAMQGRALEYSKLLLKSIHKIVDIKPIPTLSTYFHQSKKFLIHRFEYILNRKENAMLKLNLIQKMMLLGIMALAIAFSCQKEKPVEPSKLRGGSFDYSIKSLRAGLVDSQKVDYDTPPTPVGGFEAIQRFLVFPESIKKIAAISNVKIDDKGEVVAFQRIYPIPLEQCSPTEVRAIGYADGKISGAVQFFKWTPAMKDARPISAWITLPIQFDLGLSVEQMIHKVDTSKLAEIEPKLIAGEHQPYDVAPEPIGPLEQYIKYPEPAKNAGIEGTVYVQLTIDVQGNVVDTKIIKSSGNNSLDEAAIAGMKQTKWRPAQYQGQPVAVTIMVPSAFTIKKQ